MFRPLRNMIRHVPMPYLSMANIIAHFIDTANGFFLLVFVTP